MKAIGSLILATALGGVAFGGPRDFVVEHSGVGGTSEQAAPYLDTFLRYAERVLKWPPNTAQGRFFPDAADAVAYIESKKPGYGMLDPELWLELQKKEELVVLATIRGRGQAASHYSLVVKNPAYKTLDDLRGKTLISNHLQSPRFLSKLVFDGKIDAQKYFKLVPTSSPLKGLKAVKRDEADVTIVDDEQLAQMKSKFGDSLRAIYTSPALPPMPVVGFAKNSTAAEREAFSKMLFSMCSDSKGAEVCKSLQITQFVPPDPHVLDAAVHRFEK